MSIDAAVGVLGEAVSIMDGTTNKTRLERVVTTGAVVAAVGAIGYMGYRLYQGHAERIAAKRTEQEFADLQR